MGIFLSECTSTKHTVAEALALAATPTVIETAKPAPAPSAALGQMVYQSKCYQCHDLPNASSYSRGEWSDIMVSMSRKAHLSDEETQQVIAFVHANSRQ
jgi:mono/diheme cytochrome c family protein